MVLLFVGSTLNWHSNSISKSFSPRIVSHVQTGALRVWSPSQCQLFSQKYLPSAPDQAHVGCIVSNNISRVKLFRTPLKMPHYSQLDDSEAWITDSSVNSPSGFDIVVHRLVDHADLPHETIFGCVLTIPGTNYEVREESIYRHRGGRKC